MNYHILNSPADGETVNGDAYFIKQVGEDFFFIITDGLGHGEEAAYASQKAIKYFSDHIPGNIETLLLGCHNELIGSRGVVAGIVYLDMISRKWYSAVVGNIDIQIVSKVRKYTIASRGILGYRIAEKIHINKFDYNDGDLLIMNTDGIKENSINSSFFKKYNTNVLEITEWIMKEYRNINDDATVLAAR